MLLLTISIGYKQVKEFNIEKTELIQKIAKEKGLTLKEAKALIDEVLENIINSVVNEEGRISFPGFGTFERMVRKARICRNSIIGESIKVEARNAVRFKPGSYFKKALIKK